MFCYTIWVIVLFNAACLLFVNGDYFDPRFGPKYGNLGGQPGLNLEKYHSSRVKTL